MSRFYLSFLQELKLLVLSINIQLQSLQLSASLSIWMMEWSWVSHLIATKNLEFHPSTSTVSLKMVPRWTSTRSVLSFWTYMLLVKLRIRMEILWPWTPLDSLRTIIWMMSNQMMIKIISTMNFVEQNKKLISSITVWIKKPNTDPLRSVSCNLLSLNINLNY